MAQAPYPYPSPSGTEEWAQDFLYGVGAPKEQGLYGGPTENAYVEQWEQAESPSGYGANPLGTEQTESGSWAANSAGVQGYTSWGEGLQATYDTLAGDPGNSALVADLQSGTASPGELDSAQLAGSWATGNEPNLTGQGADVPFTSGPAAGPGEAVAAGAAGTVAGYGNNPTPGGNSKVPGWLNTIWNLQQSGTPNQGPGGTFGGTFGGVESAVVKVAIDLGIGAVGFLFLAGGMIVVFGPSFLRRAGGATGFGQPSSLKVANIATQRQTALRRDIEERESRRESARVFRDRQKQYDELQRIDARKKANLELIEAKKAAKGARRTVKGPAPSAKPRGRMMNPPGPRPRTRDEPQFTHGPQGQGSSVGEQPTKVKS